ncbi:MAG TPA: hypothetical protein DHW63_11300 [Hyphomonadaceae bacterium]|nr:hypothetical protein [Hyphomonadaceae bacterium]
MRLRLQPRSSKHREELAKLTATLINGAAIACLVGASFGPWLNPALDWGWRSFVLLLAAASIHVLAQLVLSFAYERDPR